MLNADELQTQAEKKKSFPILTILIKISVPQLYENSAFNNAVKPQI